MSFARKHTPRVRVYPSAIPESQRRNASMVALNELFSAPIEKSAPVRSEAYRRLVAALPCKNCGIDGNSQAAHPNTGKAKGLKADDRLCFPLCAVRFNAPGCHFMFDQHQLFPKSERAGIESKWAAETRQQIETLGLWPANLPKVTE